MQTAFLTSLAGTTGPVATVCLDVPRTGESAAAELALKVRAVRAALADQGAPPQVADAVADRLLEGDGEPEEGAGGGRAVVADAEGRLLLDQALAGPPLHEVAEWSAVPDLLPLLRQLPARLPHVVAVVDRVGADVEVVGASGGPVEDTVEGDTRYVHKVRVGGWSQLRYQHGSEEVWARNAGRAAAAVDRAARAVQARFVLVAGDERARRLLLERLSLDVAPLVVTTDRGGRGAGADRQGVTEVARELVAEHSAREDADALERLRIGLHRGEAVVGTDAVLAALREGRVALLLVADTGVGGEVLSGPGPLDLGVKHEETAAMGLRDPERVRAEPALLRAAVAQDADVVVVPAAALPDRTPVAAVLRFARTPSADLLA